MAHVIEWLVAKFSGRSTTGREPTFHPSSFFKNLTITSAVGLELLNMLQICHTHSQSKHVANLFGSLFFKVIPYQQPTIQADGAKMLG
jgi:hypothetical protein